MSPFSLEFDDYDLHDFTRFAARFTDDRFAYVVTPNTDHVIRYYDDPMFRELYRDASYILLDSQFLAYALRQTHNLNPRVCAGSDLTAKLFTEVIGPADNIVLIGASANQAELLRKKYGLTNLQHFNPPMGFVKNPQALAECIHYIEEHSPFRFCLLAVGSPQQEIVAQQLKARGRARGMALCIGASINFITGDEKRAPRWMQQVGCEWLYRLLQNPQRLARRYLVRGPRIFALLSKLKISVRRPVATASS